MAIETAEAFAARASAAVTERDAEGYKALFDLPCAVWGDRGVDLRLTTQRLDEVFAGVVELLEGLGRPRHRYRIDATRLLGSRLTALRVLTWLELRDGTRTDPMSELWIIREREGRLGITALVSPMSVSLFDPLAAAGAVHPDAEEPGGPFSPVEFCKAVERMVNTFDSELNQRLLAVPYLRFTDDVTGIIRTVEERARMIESAHRLIGAEMDGRARVELLAERPYGQTLTALRIRYHGVLPDFSQSDPSEELWILRDAGRGLQLCGVVNPTTHELMKTEDHFAHGDDLQ